MGMLHTEGNYHTFVPPFVRPAGVQLAQSRPTLKSTSQQVSMVPIVRVPRYLPGNAERHIQRIVHN